MPVWQLLVQLLWMRVRLLEVIWLLLWAVCLLARLHRHRMVVVHRWGQVLVGLVGPWLRLWLLLQLRLLLLLQQLLVLPLVLLLLQWLRL